MCWVILENSFHKVFLAKIQDFSVIALVWIVPTGSLLLAIGTKLWVEVRNVYLKALHRIYQKFQLNFLMIWKHFLRIVNSPALNYYKKSCLLWKWQIPWSRWVCKATVVPMSSDWERIGWSIIRTCAVASTLQHRAP